MQECIVLNVLGPAILIQSWSALFLFLFQPKLSLFCKSPGFSPRWGPLSLSPSQFVQLCWATLYSSDHQASRNLFSGPFRIPAQTFSFFSPHYISLCLRNQASKNVKCHRTVDCRDQTVTERPVRPRVSAPVVCMNTRECIFVPRPVTFTKSTFHWQNLQVSKCTLQKVEVVKRNKLCIPTKIKNWNPRTPCRVFYFTTALLHCISILGSVLNIKGLKAVQKFHFFKFIKFTLPNVVKAFRKTNVCSTIFLGGWFCCEKVVTVFALGHLKSHFFNSNMGTFGDFGQKCPFSGRSVYYGRANLACGTNGTEQRGV